MHDEHAGHEKRLAKIEATRMTKERQAALANETSMLRAAIDRYAEFLAKRDEEIEQDIESLRRKYGIPKERDA